LTRVQVLSLPQKTSCGARSEELDSRTEARLAFAEDPASTPQRAHPAQSHTHVSQNRKANHRIAVTRDRGLDSVC
jgi:hypothetical protein